MRRENNWPEGKEFEMEERKEREKAIQASTLSRQGRNCLRSQKTLLAAVVLGYTRKEKEFLFFISTQGDFPLVCLQFLHFARVMSRM